MKAGRARGHLIASVYGGAGNLPENFVPMYQVANQLMYNTIEQRVEKSLKAGGHVYLWVRPVYDGKNPLIPSSIAIVARGDVDDNCYVVNSEMPTSSCLRG
jgi:large repetitive protein